MNSKNANGEYYVTYVLNNPPPKVDGTVWSVAVEDYLKRNGVDAANITANTTMASVDFPEIRRTYNRLIGEGKQRRTEDSHPSTTLVVKEQK